MKLRTEVDLGGDDTTSPTVSQFNNTINGSSVDKHLETGKCNDKLKTYRIYKRSVANAIAQSIIFMLLSNLYVQRMVSL